MTNPFEHVIHENVNVVDKLAELCDKHIGIHLYLNDDDYYLICGKHTYISGTIIGVIEDATAKNNLIKCTRCGTARERCHFYKIRGKLKPTCKPCQRSASASSYAAKKKARLAKAQAGNSDC